MSSQTIWINSLIIARQNVPITFIDSETTLSEWIDIGARLLLIGSKEIIWIVSFDTTQYHYSTFIQSKTGLNSGLIEFLLLPFWWDESSEYFKNELIVHFNI